MRLPQSLQSVPSMHSCHSAPGPPSSPAHAADSHNNQSIGSSSASANSQSNPCQRQQPVTATTGRRQQMVDRIIVAPSTGDRCRECVRKPRSGEAEGYAQGYAEGHAEGRTGVIVAIEAIVVAGHPIRHHWRKRADGSKIRRGRGRWWCDAHQRTNVPSQSELPRRRQRWRRRRLAWRHWRWRYWCRG